MNKCGLNIHEGRFSGGIYHLIRLDQSKVKAQFCIPTQFHDTAFLEGANQKITQGRMSPGDAMQRAFGKFREFWETGKTTLDNFLRSHPTTVFVSDASNAPFNEAHFSIDQGELLPLPGGSDPLTGKHYVLSTVNQTVSFPIVDLEDPSTIETAQQGFFVPKIIHEGQPIRLLDEVPGPGRISISDYRGHLGQLVKEAEYSEMNSQKRVDIHTQIMEYLRDPRKYMEIIQAMLSGQAIDFGQYGSFPLPLNTFNHTYWLESFSGTLYCFKTYPAADGSSAGVTFNDGPDLLLAICRRYNIKIKDAYIGTNGRDVRVLVNNNGQLERVTQAQDGTILGDERSFNRPSANFIAFYN